MLEGGHAGDEAELPPSRPRGGAASGVIGRRARPSFRYTLSNCTKDGETVEADMPRNCLIIAFINYCLIQSSTAFHVPNL